MALARCHECPLKTTLDKRGQWMPVLAKLPPKADTVIIGEFPGKQETELEMPFVGPQSMELQDALDSNNINRDDLAMTYVIACRYPNDNPKVFHAKLRKRNRHLRSQGRSESPTPEVCCSDRLRAELEGKKNWITLGSAVKLLPRAPSLFDVRGGPMEVEGVRVLPTLSPRHVFKERRWRWVFHSDMAKAFRYFNGKLRWKEPEVVYTPTPKQLRDIIKTHWTGNKSMVAYDVETDGLNPWTAKLRCLALADSHFAVLIPLLGIDGTTRFYNDRDQEQIREILRQFFIDPDIRKSGWNSGSYDRASIEANFGVTPTPHVDGILLHRLGWPENRHNLWFAGSTLTDAPAWKSEHTATGAASDQELWVYNARDSCVTHQLMAPIMRKVEQNGHKHLYGKFAKLQDICFGMNRLGLHVDEDRRQHWEAALDAESQQHLQELQQIAPNLNPRSPAQMGRLLFDQWALPPQEITDTGEPSTAMSSIRMLLANPLVDDEQREFLNHLRFYKRADKLLNTFIRKWKPGTFDSKKNQWICTPKGYIHPSYNVTGTVGWRFSSSNPNFQTVPYKLRDCFIAPPGKILVGADMDQLELRMMAALAGAEYYLDAFENNSIDAHNLSGEFIFGRAYWNLDGAPEDRREKGSGQFKRIRDLVKTFVYAALYMADPPTIHGIVTKAEDEDGNYIYLNKRIREIATMHRKWIDRAQEIRMFWESTIKEYRRTGCVAEPVWGLKRFFDNGEDRNAIVNYPVQSAGGAIVHQGMMDLVSGPLPFDFERGTGLCNQMHDSLLFIVDEDKAEEAKEVITNTLTRRVKGIPVTFTAEATIGKCWKDT